MACDICGRVRALGDGPDLLLDAHLRQFARQACAGCCAELERRMRQTGKRAGVVILEMRAGRRRERLYLDRI